MPQASATWAPSRRKGALSHANGVTCVYLILGEAATEELPYVQI
jgi:hypothetical protein